MRARPRAVVLALAVLAAAAFLATHAPFAFYSPDGSYHAAKLLRAKEGQPFLDPVAGTPSIYPAFSHWWYGALGRILGLESLRLFSVAGVVNFLGLYAGFLLLGRAALGSLERAALAGLALPLLFYAPSGRHILVANPANLALPILFAGAAFLVRSLGGSGASLLAGVLLVSLAANVVWYIALPAAALVGMRLLIDRGWLRSKSLAAGVVCAVFLPCAFTAWQLWAIRDVLPAYRRFGSSELSRLVGASTLDAVAGWSRVLVDKGNGRFAGLLQRSWLSWTHYYLGVLPFAAFVCLVAARRALRHRSPGGASASGLLFWAGVLTLVLSFGLALTGDFPRVVSVQFSAWCLLALVALEWLLRQQTALGIAGRLAIVLAGLVGLAATVLHTDQPFGADPTRATRAVIAFVQTLPNHADERIYVSEDHLRELIAFVTFKSFVNHVGGRYYSQDPESTARLLSAYRAIRDRREDWRLVLRQNGVRYLAFRHSDPRDREAGLFYLRNGRAVLQNPEWWVVEIDERER